jgi:hypothetical protein
MFSVFIEILKLVFYDLVIDAQTSTYTSAHSPYKHTHAHTTPMSTTEELNLTGKS